MARRSNAGGGNCPPPARRAPAIESLEVAPIPRAQRRADVRGKRKYEAFRRFLSQCFRQKRKTLRNNLAGIYGQELIDPWPEAGLRAEQITLEQFAEMYRRTL